jgi:hypothetical protein
MANQLIVGSSTVYTVENVDNYIYYVKSQAVATKTGATEFRVIANGNGNVKVGVFADDANYPGARLGYNNSSQAVVLGENVLSVSSHNIVNGSWYWLAINCDQTVIKRETSGGTSYYAAADYATFAFANPAPAGLTSGNHLFSISVWADPDVGGSIIPQAYYYMN